MKANGTCSGTLDCSDNCPLGKSCDAGICASLFTPADINWTDMNNVAISSADLNDTVKLVISRTNLLGKDVTYTIYKDNALWFDTRVTAQFSNKGHLIWQPTQQGTYYFIAKVSDVADSYRSNNLAVSGTINNARSQIRITKPAENDTYIVESSTGKTRSIPFEIEVSDPDDVLNVIWEFDDENLSEFTNCNNGGNCNTAHSYGPLNVGTRKIKVSTKETTRPENQRISAYDIKRIFIFKEGYTLFAIIDSPNYQMTVFPFPAGVYRIDATSSYVSNCTTSSLEACLTKSSSCSVIQDSFSSDLRLWCYKLANATSKNPEMIFTWIFDNETPFVTNSTPFDKVFLEAREYNINLKINYTITL
jgi:hypothetical protein